MKKYFDAIVKDCNDGSGDCYIDLDPSLLAEMDWCEGDELSFKTEGQTIIVTNVTKETRDRLKEKFN